MHTTLASPALPTDPLPLTALLVRAAEGQPLDLGDHRGRIIVSAAQSGGALLLAEMEVDPDGGPPPHVHAHEDELFHILDGRFEFRIGDTTLAAGPGETVFAPRRLPHVWRCVSETPGRLLGLVTPGGNFEAFVTGIAARGFDPAGPAGDPAAAAPFVRFAAEFGIDLLPGGEEGNIQRRQRRATTRSALISASASTSSPVLAGCRAQSQKSRG